MFGPLMHFGGCFSYFVKKNIKLVTKLPLEVILGSGAAAAIAAVFRLLSGQLFLLMKLLFVDSVRWSWSRNCCGVQCTLGCFAVDG